LLPTFDPIKNQEKKSKKNWKKKVKRKEGRRREEKVITYSQQAWRRYNLVITQGWSPCGLPIHAFLMFKSLLKFFELVLVL
jgi:hypothetical protein